MTSALGLSVPPRAATYPTADNRACLGLLFTFIKNLAGDEVDTSTASSILVGLACLQGESKEGKNLSAELVATVCGSQTSAKDVANSRVFCEYFAFLHRCSRISRSYKFLLLCSVEYAVRVFAQTVVRNEEFGQKIIAGLYVFLYTLDDHPSLDLFFNSFATASEKTRVLKMLFEYKVFALSFDLVELAIYVQPTLRYFGRLYVVLRWIADNLCDQLGFEVAHIASVGAFDNKLFESLKAHLKEKHPKPLIYNFYKDPALIGGFSVRIGDLLFDASIRTKLASVATAFQGAL